MTLKIHLLSLLLVVLSSSIFAQTGSIEITINGIENNDGVIQIGLYNTEASFPDFDRIYKGASPKANKIVVSHNFTPIPAGKYAIAVWHDEDEDKKMNKNMFGVPKESYGFSNNKFGKFGPPDFQDASFEVVDNETAKLIINLK